EPFPVCRECAGQMVGGKSLNMKNQTMITEVFLLGFPNLGSFRILIFSQILGFYLLTLFANILIIVLVIVSKILHSPMYFFLTQMSISDMLMTTNIVPEMLSIIYNKGNFMSLKCCIFQLYLFAVSAVSECFLLTVMSYDRYLAICFPLHYNSIMDSTLCLKLIFLSWILGLSLTLIISITIGNLQFCGPDHIDHFFCDIAPLMELSCSDTLVVQIEILLLSAPILIIPFTIVMVSYIYIVLTILKNPSITGRQKAFSTCSSHLAVVSIYYGTLICTYTVSPKGKSASFSKILCLFYTVVTPILNPIIYTLRNKDIKEQVKYDFEATDPCHVQAQSAVREVLLVSLKVLMGEMRLSPYNGFLYIAAHSLYSSYLVGVLTCYVGAMKLSSQKLAGVAASLVQIFWQPHSPLGISKRFNINNMKGHIDHFFCDVVALLELFCSETVIVQIETYLLSVPVLIIPFIIVTVSYIYIVRTIIRIPSITGRQKAFSTCSSHLAVVSIYYGTLICTYSVPPKGKSASFSKILCIFYTVVTPILNPIIYTLRNKDIKEARKRAINSVKRQSQILVSKILHSPMYFFLTQMSISDMLMTTNIVPEMLSIIYNKGNFMSLKCCIFQLYLFALYLFGVSVGFECFLLTVMSYDRYLAICFPLLYNSIMDSTLCLKLIVLCWILGLSLMLNTSITIGNLQFCGPDHIDHFFCDVAPLLELSCSNTLVVQIETLVLCVPVIIIPFTIVMVSYIYIVLTIIRIPSITGRQKAFSTCSSHLAVVSIYYGTLICTYTVPPKGKSASFSKILCLFYTVVTPILNPIIYTLRNKDIKEAVMKHYKIQDSYGTGFYTLKSERVSLRLQFSLKRSIFLLSEFYGEPIRNQGLRTSQCCTRVVSWLSTAGNHLSEEAKSLNMKNQTMITEVFLLGFPNLVSFRILIVNQILGIYLLTLLANILIIVLVIVSKILHSPMYFFLTQMSISEMLMTTNIVPEMLSIIYNEGNSMSLKCCIFQLYLFAVSECSECFLLTVMSYDRYLAICFPLHYNSIMDSTLCLKLIVLSWILGLSLTLIISITIGNLQFCGPDHIDHLFCDIAPLLELSCSDSLVVQIEILLLSAPILIIPFTFVMVSYIYIVLTILKNPSITGRQKAFSTCSSHLAVVSIYYGTLICTNTVSPKGKSASFSKILCLFYTVVTPILNPIIYTLKNKDIKEAYPIIVRGINQVKYDV
ncbi:olfactory receptor OLF1, partial [Pelobates cultripes]